MTTTPVEIQKQGYALEIKITHPESRNALTPLLIESISAALATSENDDTTRFVILRGEQDIFCSGFQLSSFLAAAESPEAEALAGKFFDMLLALTASSKIVICEIDGDVLGGGVGIVSAADYVVSSSKSRFVCPETKYGIIPAIIFPFMQRKIGAAKAARMSLTAEEISPQTALQWGLIDSVHDHVNIGTTELMRSLIKVHPAGMARMKSYRRELDPISENTRALAIKNFLEMIQAPQAQERLSSLYKISQRSK